MVNPSKTNLSTFKRFSFAIFVVFCIQFTELKIDVIKIAEISLLLTTPFIYGKFVNRWILRLLGLFTIWFVLTIICNPFRDFYLLSEVSILKTPYIISFGRYLELLACINLMALIYSYFKDLSYAEILKIVKLIVVLNICVLLGILLIYGLHRIGFIEETYISYVNFRLRGGYSEGGPFGLMLSFIFILTFMYKSRYKGLVRFLLAITIVFFARSKAGILLIIIWYILMYYKWLYFKIRRLNIIILIVGGIITSIVFVKLASFYINDIKHIKEEVVKRPTDINLVMGRIAGIFIFPDMIKDHPVVGIGLGNYPLMRNNPDYLDFIPVSPKGKTDAHGFGGLIQLLVDGGLIIFIPFLVIMYLFNKKLKKQGYNLEIYHYAFLLFFTLGVQIYFLYPWVLFGIVLSLSNKTKQTCKTIV